MATCGSAQSLYLGFPAVWRPVVQKGYFPGSRKLMKLIPEKFAHEFSPQLEQKRMSHDPGWPESLSSQ